jgi:hypothetical protein
VLKLISGGRNTFYNLCQRELHARNSSWTITVDTDERIFVNPLVLSTSYTEDQSNAQHIGGRINT